MVKRMEDIVQVKTATRITAAATASETAPTRTPMAAAAMMSEGFREQTSGSLSESID